MKRRIFLFAAATSLLLCLATIGSWIRSYWYLDILGAQSAVTEDGRSLGGSVGLNLGLIECHIWRRQYLRRPASPEPSGVVHISHAIADTNTVRDWRAALG